MVAFLGQAVATGTTGATTYPYFFPCNGGEFLICLVEDANEGSTPTPTPSGWTIITGTPTGTGSGATGTAIRGYYKFAAPGDTYSMTLGDLGDHQEGVILAFIGVDRTNPFDTAAVASFLTPGSTSVVFPAITTANADSLVVSVASNVTDTTTAQGSSFAHAGLTGLGSGNVQGTDGNGGGFSYLYGIKATAGATGTGSCTLANSSVQGLLTLALRTDQATVATATKLASYAVLGTAADAATVSKAVAYAVVRDSFSDLVGTPGVTKTLDSGATSTVDLPAGNAGDTAYVLCGNYPSGYASVVGSVNGAYTKDIGQFDSSNNSAEIWRCTNVAAAGETITLTPTISSGNYVSAVACRFSDILRVSPLDKTGTANDTKTVNASGANVQAHTLSLIFAVADTGLSNMGFAVPVGYNLLALENASDTYTGFLACYKYHTAIQTSGGVLTAASTQVDQVIATYKVAPPVISGSASVTLGSLTAEGTGTLTSSGIAGAADITLGALTSTGAGTLPIVGSADIALGAMFSEGAAGLSVAGAADITLGALTAEGAGTLSLAGAADVTLGELTTSGAGALALTGAADITLGTMFSEGAAGLSVSGEASITLGELTVVATGETQALGSGTADITLGALTVIGAGVLSITGSAEITLGEMLSEGAAGLDVAGAATITLGAMTASGAGAVGLSGVASITLGALTVEASGELQPVNSGTASITLGALTASGAGVSLVHGAGVLALGALTVEGEGTLSLSGEADITLGVLAAHGTGGVRLVADADITLGGLTISATGAKLFVGEASITLGELVASGTGVSVDRWAVGAATSNRPTDTAPSRSGDTHVSRAADHSSNRPGDTESKRPGNPASRRS